MKSRTLLLIAGGTLAALTIAVGIAFATDSAGVTATAHVVGATLPDRVKVNADRIKFKTKNPVDISVVTLTIAPGGTTGWHSHPGFAVIAVSQGAGTLYSADCSAETFHAGQAFVETGDDPPTVFRNNGAEPVVLTVSFFAPRGAGFHRDAPNPGCAVS
ncbi:MAG TPA: cupin domain-containing protein [Solirubrobacteraceae bacterium]|nr:cupin domain-containing protein [Solirubrobacteraceae bacterium]